MQAMHCLASKLLNSWMMDRDSEQTPLIGLIEEIVLDPETLKVALFGLGVGRGRTKFFVRSDQTHFDRTSGMMQTHFDAVGETDDFIREHDILRTHCTLIGYRVADETGRYLGSVRDYSLTSQLFQVERLYITSPFWKRLRTPQLIIARTQVLEVIPAKKLVQIKNIKPAQRSRASQAIPA